MRCLLLILILLLAAPTVEAAEKMYDLVIYGGTSAGVAAAVQARRMDKSVVVIEPSGRIGGLTTGGLGQTDIGNKNAIGGVSREFYQRVREHYQDPQNWKWQEPEEYRDGGQTRTGEGEDAMWTFEPSAALKIMHDWVKEHDIPVVYHERLDRTGNTGPGEVSRGVKKVGARIVEITMESGRKFRGRIFLDATYEGDLMASAGVNYTVGREGVDKYDESYNGVQPNGPGSDHHNFVRGVDPYRKPGDPSSGLLPFIDPGGPGEVGSGDHRVQAYCFRMCMTDHPENRIPFAKPEGYNEQWYELLLRNYEAGYNRIPWINSRMPNRKTDTNNRDGFSTDFIGQNYEYPEASYQERERIVARHRLYQQGLMWTLANHERVPENVRREVSRWGTNKDEFARDDGWQQQLYVREARRMLGPYMMTQHHCQSREVAPDSIGLGAYGMDSHHMQRYITDKGDVRNEGNIETGVAGPYPVSYRSITPKESECTNLLVPVCLSASHIAFGSIRMEPVFMILGQSAATAAAQAIDAGATVQTINYENLRERLLADGQILERPSSGVSARKLEGVVVDDRDAQRTGEWLESSIIGPYVEAGYLHDDNAGQGAKSVRFEATLPPGRYEVRVAYSTNPNRATNVPIVISHAQGETERRLNQQNEPQHNDLFTSLGEYQFSGDARVEIGNRGANGYVVVDAVQFLPRR